MRQVARAVELEGVNAQLCTELDAAWPKLAEVERHEHTLTSKNKGLKKDLQDAHIAHDAVVKDKAEVLKNERAKL
jgi:hypothetical protein